MRRRGEGPGKLWASGPLYKNRDLGFETLVGLSVRVQDRVFYHAHAIIMESAARTSKQIGVRTATLEGAKPVIANRWLRASRQTKRFRWLERIESNRRHPRPPKVLRKEREPTYRENLWKPSYEWPVATLDQRSS